MDMCVNDNRFMLNGVLHCTEVYIIRHIICSIMCCLRPVPCRGLYSA